MIDFHRILICRLIFHLVFLCAFILSQHAARAGEAFLLPSEEQFPQSGFLYHAPMAGQEFHDSVFGRDVLVPPRDRRSTSAWDFGLSAYKPAPGDQEILPFGDFYFWRHPDDDSLFRAEISVLYNDVFYARKLPDSGNLELVFTFTNFTIPFAQSELIDGAWLKTEELVWGYVRPGIGTGCRRQASPGHQDNMLAADLTFEPGYLFFRKGSQTAENFILPHDTFDFRAHLQVRRDALERTLLELPHRGYATGADLAYGYRPEWRNWGVNGLERFQRDRSYRFLNGYFVVASGVPGIQNDRHRVIGSLHAGAGRHLDRFSAQRIGGGPDPVGEEYESSAEPVLPGAAMQEFFPRHYVIGFGEYRWDPVFFVSLGFDASVAWLDRLRNAGTDRVSRDDRLTSLGARVFIGFLFNTRLQLGYHYNFSVVRNGNYGGQEILLNISGNL